MQSFRMGFGARRGKDVDLTLKLITQGWNIGRLPGVNILNEDYDIEQLIELYHQMHCFVYPSWGEGFGLTPLQALATGMPTITVPAWAPYAKFIHPELAIASSPYRSQWPMLHPGNMLKPNVDSIIKSMLYVTENYEELVDWHMAQVPAVMEEYSWDRQTAKVFTDLETRLKSLAH